LEKGSARCDECGYALTAAVQKKVDEPSNETPPTEPSPKEIPPPPPQEPPLVEPPPMAETPAPSPSVTHPAVVDAKDLSPKKKKTALVAVLLIVGFAIVIILAVGGYFAWPHISQMLSQKTLVGGTSQQEDVEPSESAVTEETEPIGVDHKQNAMEYQAIKQWDQAESEWQKYIEEYPEDWAALFELSKVNYEQGQLRNALERLQKYLNVNPSDADAHALAGRIHARRNEDTEAENSYLAAVAHDPENGAYHLELGEIYADNGFSDKAIGQFQEALEKMPDSEKAMWKLITELDKTNSHNSAREMAEKYIQQFPEGVYIDSAKHIAGRSPLREETSSAESMAGDTTSRPQRGEQAADSREISQQREETSTSSTREIRGSGTSTTRQSESRHDTSGPSSSKPSHRPKPPPSPFVNVIMDATALNYSGKYAKVTVSFAGIQQTFNSGSQVRMDNVKKGSHQYNVTVTYFSISNNEQEGTYTGNGVFTIRYPNQRLTLVRIGDRIIIK